MALRLRGLRLSLRLQELRALWSLQGWATQVQRQKRLQHAAAQVWGGAEKGMMPERPGGGGGGMMTTDLLTWIRNLTT